jgi:hypothetical protein
MKQFKVTVKHDGGWINFKVGAMDAECAALAVMKTECCPKWAIRRVKELSDISSAETSAEKFISAMLGNGIPHSAIGRNDWDSSPHVMVYLTIPYGSKRNGGKYKSFRNKFGARALNTALKFWASREIEQ